MRSLFLRLKITCVVNHTMQRAASLSYQVWKFDPTFGALNDPLDKAWIFVLFSSEI